MIKGTFALHIVMYTQGHVLHMHADIMNKKHRALRIMEM